MLTMSCSSFLLLSLSFVALSTQSDNIVNGVTVDPSDWPPYSDSQKSKKYDKPLEVSDNSTVAEQRNEANTRLPPNTKYYEFITPRYTDVQMDLGRISNDSNSSELAPLLDIAKLGQLGNIILVGTEIPFPGPTELPTRRDRSGLYGRRFSHLRDIGIHSLCEDEKYPNTFGGPSDLFVFRDLKCVERILYLNSRVQLVLVKEEPENLFVPVAISTFFPAINLFKHEEESEARNHPDYGRYHSIQLKLATTFGRAKMCTALRFLCDFPSTQFESSY